MTGNGITMKRHVCTLVNMNGILWEWIVEHITIGSEDVPIWLGDTISSFPAVDSGEFKRAMDERILMCQINPFMKWK